MCLGLAAVGKGVLFPALLIPLVMLFKINIILAIFNLIPAFPLDGGRIFRALWWFLTRNLVKATKIARNVTFGIAFLLPLGGLLWGGFFDFLWLLFISWLLVHAEGLTRFLGMLLLKERI